MMLNWRCRHALCAFSVSVCRSVNSRFSYFAGTQKEENSMKSRFVLVALSTLSLVACDDGQADC